MKQIILEGEPTTFFITENGFVIRKDTNNWYTPYENNGYLSYMLKWNGKTYPRRIHRLLAECFLENPNGLPYVHHLDGNPFNNSLTNLQWVSIEENNDYENKKTPEELDEPIVYLEKDLATEEWKQYFNTTFWVSNLGRVKNIKTQNILKGSILKSGYLRYTLKIKGKAVGKFAHRLVLETWHGEIPENLVVNHINGNKLDNTLINLEVVSQSDNILKSIYKTQTSTSNKIVGEYDEQQNLIQWYPSLTKAAKEKNVHNTSILEAIRKHTRSCGSYWKYIIE